MLKEDKKMNIFEITKNMAKTPAHCIFQKGDLVKLSRIGKCRLYFRKDARRRRKIAKVIGFSKKYPHVVRVKWIEAENDWEAPVQVPEKYAWYFLDFAD